MVTARQFAWLPNALTLLRVASAVVAFELVLAEAWVLAFWVLTGALITDFLDGLAAKKLNAKTEFGGELDRFADLVLSASGLISLAVVGIVPWWAVVAAPLIAGFLAYDRFFLPKGGLLYRVRPMLSVGFLFVVWTAVAWIFAAQAFGWRWWYVPGTIGLLVALGSLKRHRLRAWLRLS